MINKKIRLASLAFVGVLIISNYVQPINSLISAAIGEDWYYYSTANQEFVIEEIPEKGLDLKRVSLSFENYLKENPNIQDTILYRSFAGNPLKFWHWHDYFFHKRYKYPYKRFD